MIEHILSDNTFDVTCNYCKEAENFDGSPSEIFAELVTDGWSITRENNETVHICPKCVTEWKNGGSGAAAVREKLPVIN